MQYGKGTRSSSDSWKQYRWQQPKQYYERCSSTTSHTVLRAELGMHPLTTKRDLRKLKQHYFLAITVSEWRGSFTQNRRKFNFCVAIYFVAYLRHGIFHRVALFFFSSKISFWVRCRPPHVKSLRKKNIVPLYSSVPQGTCQKRGCQPWLIGQKGRAGTRRNSVVEKVLKNTGGSPEEIFLHRKIWGLQDRSKRQDRNKGKASAEKQGGRGGTL